MRTLLTRRKLVLERGLESSKGIELSKSSAKQNKRLSTRNLQQLIGV
jgi:hypothetical protein